VLNFCQSGRDQEVLITGTGVVCPLGIGLQAAWQRLLQGPSACRSLAADELQWGTELQRVPGLRLHGAPVDGQRIRQLSQHLPRLQRLPGDMRAVVQAEPVLAMTAVALEEALLQAGLRVPLANPTRTAVLFGGSKGGLATTELLLNTQRQQALPEGIRAARLTDRNAQLQVACSGVDFAKSQTAAYGRLSRATSAEAPPAAFSAAPESLATASSTPLSDAAFATAFGKAFTTDGASRLIMQLLEARGPGLCPVAACATGLISVLQGAAMIHAGLCDVCITGSADAALRTSILASFHRLQVLSRHPEAATACRPFDATRDGFVIGDGAAVLILESRRHARLRGAKPLAQVLGGGWLSDPTGITQMDDSGTTVAELLSRCCASVGAAPDVLSLHGTGTETNDLVEARGIVRALGDRLPVCFATKGASGHLLGAAGSVETALLTAAMTAAFQPGTRNLTQPDPRCSIPLPPSGTPLPPNTIWGKLSLGFGGHAACGLFRAATR